MTTSESIFSVTVVGLGHIGLPTAAVLAMKGIRVHGADIDLTVVSGVAKGESHFREPGLVEAVHMAVANGKLTAGTLPRAASVFVIAVPTPIDVNRRADLANVDAATRAIAPLLVAGNLVILESTSPVGTTERLTRLLEQLRPDLTFPHRHPEGSQVHVAYCPERVLPGHALHEIVWNERTVGGIDGASTAHAIAFYELFCRGKVSSTSVRVAELSKLVENAYRDVNIAFANELSLLCEAMGLEVHDVIATANRHPRVGILQPGPGVGGHCIPVDPWFIAEACPNYSRLIRTAREVNEFKTRKICESIASLAASFAAPRIALLGLSYKSDVDDIRNSPALEIAVNCARARIGELIIVEPHLTELPDELRHNSVRAASLEDALATANIFAVLVAHTAFQNLSSCALEGKAVIDTVGLLRRC